MMYFEPVFSYNYLQKKEEEKEQKQFETEREKLTCAGTLSWIQAGADPNDDELLTILENRFDLTDMEMFCQEVLSGEEDDLKYAAKEILNYMDERRWIAE